MLPDSPGNGAQRGERRRSARGTRDLDATAVVTDDVLARRAGLGDKDAFAHLITRHGPGLYRYVSHLLHQGSDAEDCIQDTLIAAWRALPEFRGESSVRTWLFVLGRHEAQKHAHRNRPRFPASGSRPAMDFDQETVNLRDTRADTAEEAVDSGLLAALDGALLLLPERQRSVWILRELEGLSYDEIATVVGISAPAVRGLLHRARDSVAVKLEGWR